MVDFLKKVKYQAKYIKEYNLPVLSIFHKNRIWIVELILISIALAFGLFGLDRSPTAWYDETYYNEIAYQLAFHGKLASGVEPGFLFREEIYLGPPLHPFIQSLVFRIFDVGIWQVRISCLFFYILTGLLIFFATSIYFKNQIAGILTSALYLFDPAVVKSWRSGRQDAMAIMFGILALLFILYVISYQKALSKRKFLILVFLAGITGGMACMTHPNSLSFVITGLIFLVFGLKSWNLRIQSVAYYAIGGILGLLPWIFIILLNKDIFLKQGLAASSHNSSLINFVPGLIKQAKHLISTYKIFPLLILTQILGFIYGFFSSKYRLFSFAGCWVLLLYFLVIHNSHPIPYVVSVLILGVGSLVYFFRIDESFKAKRSKLITAFFILIFISCFSVVSLRAFTIIWQWEGRSYNMLIEEWQDKIKQGSSVAAPAACWYASLKNDNDYRFNRITSGIATRKDQNKYQKLLIQDKVEYLIIPSNHRLSRYLPKEHINLFTHIDEIHRPVRKLTGIQIETYNF
ncbi:phospholipid carrier-dependent glycosyltransferase, partial [Candidatus Poribacteria bacterium]|nr:phospholipid carrier-dependent glycosyltransferase [Candidatus Poribacteria bacterium]